MLRSREARGQNGAGHRRRERDRRGDRRPAGRRGRRRSSSATSTTRARPALPARSGPRPSTSTSPIPTPPGRRSRRSGRSTSSSTTPAPTSSRSSPRPTRRSGTGSSRVNLVGVLACTHAALPGMQAAGYGRIVNIASEAGRVGSKGSAVYSAAKGGVIAFTKVMARENARYGITANAIAPGPIDTPLLQRAVELGEIGERIVETMAEPPSCAASASRTRSPPRSPSSPPRRART